MHRTLHNVSLPSDFAQRLLDNQIQFKLAQTPSKEVISNLIELYTYGVEYYESIKSYKYLYFQTKMKQLFNAGTPLEIMNKKTIDQEKDKQMESPIQKKMKSPKEQQKIEAFKIKQKQQKMLNEIVQRTSYTLTSSQTKHILKDSDQKQVKVQKVIHQQLQTQQRSLQEKLKLRKVRTLVAKSMSSIQLFQTPTRDSLFDGEGSEKRMEGSPHRGGIIKKPLKVNFESFINENDQSEQEGGEEDARKRNKSIFSSMRIVPIKIQETQMTEEEVSKAIEQVDFGNC